MLFHFIFSNSALRGNNHLINYLQDMVCDSNIPPSHIPSQIQLILTFSKPILMAQPMQGLSIFTSCHGMQSHPSHDRRCSNYSIIPAGNVLDHLKRTCPDPSISIMYLESLIHDGEEVDWTFHNELIVLYLESLLKWAPSIDKDSELKLKYDEMRSKLIKFLQSSPHYLAEKLLTKFPWDSLLEERAILLARLGQHEAALSIYVHSLHDYDMAEKYCHQFYNEESEEARDVYLSLLKVYLSPSKDAPDAFKEKLGGSPSFTSIHAITAPLSLNINGKESAEDIMEVAFQFLCRNSNRIAPAQALALFSNNLPMHKIMPFVNSVLSSYASTARQYQVEKNLLRAEYIQLQEENLVEKNYRVMIDSDTLCSKCSKRIGMSAFIVFPAPSRDILHYKCSEEKFERINQMRFSSNST